MTISQRRPKFKDWASCPNQAKLYRELAELDLLENIAELDVFGFTVVPPEKVAPPAFHARVKDALVRVMEGRFGPLDPDGMTWKDRNQIFRMVLWEDRVFEELVLNPAGLGLVPPFPSASRTSTWSGGGKGAP